MVRTQSAALLALLLLACQSIPLFAAPPPRTDVYGDPLPDGVRVRMGTIRLRLANAQAIFSADGRTLIACGKQNGVVRHWDVASGRLVREMQLCKTPREKKELNWVTLGGRCAAMRMKDTVILRDVASGEEHGRLPLKDAENVELTPSADGKFLVVRKDAQRHYTTVELWDVARGKKLQTCTYAYGVRKAILSRDGKRLALRTGDHDIRLWDTVHGKELMSNESGGWRDTITFSPDGKTLAVNGWDGPIQLLDTTALKERALLTRPENSKEPLAHLEYSADGRLLAADDKDGIVVWDVAARRVKHRLPKCQAQELAFAPDGKTLACWGWKFGSEIRLWDVATAKALHSGPGHVSSVGSVAVSPTGKILASGASGDPYLLLWDAATGRMLHRLKGRDNWMTACVFSADGKQIVSSGDHGSIQVWDIARAAEVRRLAMDSVSDQTFLRLSPDGRCLSAIRINFRTPARAVIWDLTTGKKLYQRPYKIDVHSRDHPHGGYTAWIEEHVAFAPDGQSVTVRNGQRLDIEDVKSGRVLALLPEKVGRPVRFSPDGQLIAAAALTPQADPFEQPTMEGMRLIESATGQEVVSIQTGYGHLIDFSIDGRLLATIDKESFHIWDVATGDEWFRRSWPEGVRSDPDLSPADSLAFLPDGRGVVTGMVDGTILVWDVLARPQRTRSRKRETLETLWSALAGEARKAHGAVYTLVETPAETVPFLAVRLKPAADSDAKLLAKLLADLDNDQFAVREAAQRELMQHSDEIEPKLRHFLENKPTREARRRIEAILASPRPVPSAATLRALRALRVLEMIGTPEARQLLHKLAGGAAAARQSQEAKAALRRLQGTIP